MKHKAIWAMFAVCAVFLAGCAGGGEAAPKVPDGWVTDTVAGKVEFAYPKDYDNTDGEFFNWSNIHASKNLYNYVVGNQDAAVTEIPQAEGTFVSQATGFEYNLQPGRVENIKMQGHDVRTLDFTISDQNLASRAWFIKIDDNTVVSIAAMFEKQNQANLDKVAKSIKIL